MSEIVVPRTSVRGRLTITLFWPRTRSASSRPRPSPTTPYTFSDSASLKVSVPSAADAHRQPHLGAALDLLAIGIDGRADRVVRDVVVGFVVLAELARAARLQAVRRGVDGDVAPARALEQRDVLGLAAGAHVGERAEAALGADLGEEVADRRNQRPALAAQVGELDAERLADLLLEDGLRLAQARRRHRLLGQRAADAIVTIDRVIAEEGGADRRAQLGLAREDAQLRLLHRRLRHELHRAVAEDHHPGLAVRGRRDVGDAAREREQQILGADREIADAELPVRIEREAVQAVRRAERSASARRQTPSAGVRVASIVHVRAAARPPGYSTNTSRSMR